jgi:CRP/FNR family transcriptional regulator, cyclic AMP receptor protein
VTDDEDDATAAASGSPAVVRVLEVDSGLADGLDAEQLASALPRSIARTLTVAEGPWWYEPSPEQEPGLLGLLVLEGVLLRELTVDRMHALEFVGPGDLIRPWTYEGDSAPVIATATWQVIEPLRIALLDRRFALRMAPWPEISAVLLDREAERARSAIVELAVRQALRIEDRLLLTLWHLADRWGRVSPRGTVLGLTPLTHGVLARLIGAQRPSVTLALGKLRERELIDRDPDGRWILLGDPPGDLRNGIAGSGQRRRSDTAA